MKAIIFDVDGTLLNVEHRLHHLDNPALDRSQQWAAFFADQHLDTTNESVAELARIIYQYSGMMGLDDGYKIAVLIVSARPDDHIEITKKTLYDNKLWFDKIYMRKSADTRPDQVVKAEILQQIIDDGYEPFLAVDDRPQVVKMWRDFGITCLQCAPDEPVRSPYQGKALLTMLIGPSGAGKTTMTSKLLPPNKVVSTDDIREEFGLGHHPDDLKRTWQIAHGYIETLLRAGMSCTLDATNLKTKDRMAVLKLVPKGQFVNYVVIDRDLDDKLKTRGWRSEELILKHHRTFQANLKAILAGDEQPNVFVHDKREKK